MPADGQPGNVAPVPAVDPSRRTLALGTPARRAAPRCINDQVVIDGHDLPHSEIQAREEDLLLERHRLHNSRRAGRGSGDGPLLRHRALRGRTPRDRLHVRHRDRCPTARRRTRHCCDRHRLLLRARPSAPHADRLHNDHGDHLVERNWPPGRGLPGLLPAAPHPADLSTLPSTPAADRYVPWSWGCLPLAETQVASAHALGSVGQCPS